MSSPDESRIPVIAAVGQRTEREGGVAALGLAEQAARVALDSTPGLRDRIDAVVVINILSGAPPDAASVIARRLGLSPRRAEVTTVGGNSPQAQVNRAAAGVAAGEHRAVLIVGAEAQRSRSTRTDRRTGEDERRGGQPRLDPGAADPVVGDSRPGIGPVELGAGLIAPVHIYALFESAIAARSQRSFAEQRTFLGEVMSRFTEVAAKNPHAWFPERRTAEELSSVSDDNRLVAEPYTKRLCAMLGVDQGAAVVVSSLEVARAAGSADRVAFCLGGAGANDVWFPSARRDPASSPAIAAAGRAALAAAGIGIDDVDHLDLYSCFPCAVEMGAEALGVGLGDTRGLTVTGGLPYFGGPGNNYTLHAIATVAERICETGGTGLVTGLGWYATKHSIGVYGVRPPSGGWRMGDTADAQEAIDGTTADVAETPEGTATVVASTVVVDSEGTPAAAPAIVRLQDGRHSAAAAAPDVLAALRGRNLAGARVTVEGSPPLYRPE